jgi:polysaccharide export outer membrane protein
MRLIRTLLLLVLPVYFISCSTQHRIPNYLENITDTSGKHEVKIPELRIQKMDQLSIQVYSESELPEKSDPLYNLPPGSGSSGQGASNNGFLVDVNGNIEYPRLGVLHVEGLTKLELEALIKKKLTEPKPLLINPSVIIRFLNFKVTFLGEVGKQGPINVPSERLTILEAVSLAGGITPDGKRNNVKVYREIDGKSEMGTIDLTSDSLFRSPYYNLMQNDVVLVDMTKRKSKGNNDQAVTQRITMALGIITSLAFIYNIFK